MIEDLNIILGRLIKTKDWHEFLVAVRRGFTRLVKRYSLIIINCC